MLPDRASSDLSREAGLKIRPLDVARRDILMWARIEHVDGI
jgi:hypothetical protein